MNNLLSKYPIPSFEKDFIQDYKNLVISYPKAGRSWLKILLLKISRKPPTFSRVDELKPNFLFRTYY